jgi:serine/arginine repetitive matrix protein 2
MHRFRYVSHAPLLRFHSCMCSSKHPRHGPFPGKNLKPDVPTNPEAQRPTDPDNSEPLPILPSASDFRTSLILPECVHTLSFVTLQPPSPPYFHPCTLPSANMLWHSLTRRFTLLRSEDGEPVGLEHLRARFAEQRARGAPNQVSEEEESMILEALGRMRVRTAAAEQQDDLFSDPGISPRQSSTNSLDTSTSSLMGNVIGNISPTPASKNTKRVQKRYSNNLFGSGKFRDDVYIRTVRGGVGAAPCRTPDRIPAPFTHTTD